MIPEHFYLYTHIATISLAASQHTANRQGTIDKFIFVTHAQAEIISNPISRRETTWLYSDK